MFEINGASNSEARKAFRPVDAKKKMAEQEIAQKAFSNNRERLKAEFRKGGCGATARENQRLQGEGKMTTADEGLKLTRQIVASGGRKYTAENIDRSRYDRLVDMGWLIPFKTNISDVEYQVPERGRAAAAIEAGSSRHLRRLVELG